MINVNIDLFKISPDRKILEAIITCPENYYFSQFDLEVHHLVDGDWIIDNYELAPHLFTIYDPITESMVIDKSLNVRTIRLDLSKLGIKDSSIFVGTFGILNKVLENTEDVNPESRIAITSDMSFVYDLLSNKVASLDAYCDKIDDDLIRNYLILWGHKEAMSLKRIEDAKLYYKILINNFSKCGDGSRCGNSNHDCGCHKLQKKGCGCKR